MHFVWSFCTFSIIRGLTPSILSNLIKIVETFFNESHYFGLQISRKLPKSESESLYNWREVSQSLSASRPFWNSWPYVCVDRPLL